MGEDAPKRDKHGIVSFVLAGVGGTSYRIERTDGSKYIFITILDPTGRAIGKRVVDTEKPENETIANMYLDYLKERTDDQ